MDIPDLNGTWKGYIHSNWEHPNTKGKLAPIPAILTINQTESNISCTMRTAEMTSYSDREDLFRHHKTGECELAYDYTSKTTSEVEHRSGTHDGRMLFTYDDTNGKILEGRYCNFRQSTGTIRLEYWKEEKYATFPATEEIHPAKQADLLKVKCPKVLFVGASPGNGVRLAINKEYKHIAGELSQMIKEGNITLEVSLATTPPDLQRAMLDHEPEILHFSGHGTKSGIVLQNESDHALTSPNKGVVNFLKSFQESLHCVVLNACYSESLAKELVEFIPFVVGMSDKISDKAALQFSTGFYMALAKEKGIPKAFEMGKALIGLSGSNDEEIVKLFERPLPDSGQNP